MDPERSSDGGFRYPVNHEPDRRPRQPTPRDQRDAQVMARRIIDDLSGPDARLVLGHVADENLTAFWSAYRALGLEVMVPGRSG